MDTILSHLLGVCEGLKWLHKTPADLTVDEMLTMQQVWENTFRSLYFKLWLPRHQSWPSFAMQLDKTCSILQSCRFILEPKYRLKRSRIMNLELSTLTLYMQYYFSQFLLRTNLIVGDPNQYGTQSITESLRQVLRQIREVVTRLSILSSFADQIPKLSNLNLLPVEPECLPLDNLQIFEVLYPYISLQRSSTTCSFRRSQIEATNSQFSRPLHSVDFPILRWGWTSTNTYHLN